MTEVEGLHDEGLHDEGLHDEGLHDEGLHDEGLHDVVASIYGSAVADDSWEAALEAIRNKIGGWAASLRIHETRGGFRDYLTSVGPRSSEEQTRAWETRADRESLEMDCALGEVRICNWASIETDNVAIGELKAFGAHETLYHCFAKTDRCSFTLSVTRETEEGPFCAGDRKTIRQLGKHFAQAADLREKHVRQRLSGQHQANALDKLNIAGILVDRFGSVIPLNQTATDLLEKGESLNIFHGKISASFRMCNSRLQDILTKIMSGKHEENTTFALTIEQRSERRHLGVVIHSTETMCPVTNRMEKTALIFARDPESSFETDPLLLQQLFSFTPAEANLAIGLAEGKSLKEIEDKLHIRHNTARAHLRAMFVKADVTRQAELVSLLTNSVAPLGRKQVARNCPLRVAD